MKALTKHLGSQILFKPIRPVLISGLSSVFMAKISGGGEGCGGRGQVLNADEFRAVFCSGSTPSVDISVIETTLWDSCRVDPHFGIPAG